MKKTPITPTPGQFPPELMPLLEGTPVFDSSCSPQARVYYLEREGGLYLKTAQRGSLETEAAMTRFFHTKGLGPEVLHYSASDRDWLLTRAVPGEDCCHGQYLSNPERLCDTLAQAMLTLHDTDPSGCPVMDLCAAYQTNARRNYQEGRFDSSLFPDNWGYKSPEEAWQVIEANPDALRPDTLVHGDFCLPNVMLSRWRFSGFIDLGGGGVGDWRMDLFWVLWSLNFNLKTDRYTERFLDACGAKQADKEVLRVIAAYEVFG